VHSNSLQTELGENEDPNNVQLENMHLTQHSALQRFIFSARSASCSYKSEGSAAALLIFKAKIQDTDSKSKCKICSAAALNEQTQLFQDVDLPFFPVHGPWITSAM
jgi:hypothetical protein